MFFQHALSGTSGSNVKLHNLRAVLLTLLRQETLSRVQLSHITGLSTTTITNLIADLVEQGVVEELGAQTTRRRRRVGRPRTALSLVPDARYALGVHIGVGHVRVTITDLLAQPLVILTCEHPLEQPATAVLEIALHAIQQALDAQSIDPTDIVGVGVGASGLVDLNTGVNVLAPNLGWREVPLRDWFAERLDWPVCVDNNVRAMALAEALFGQGQDARVLAFVYSRVGVGAGFVVGDRLYHGSGAGAGEIGHIIVVEDGEPCRCGNIGCLETLVSEPAIVRVAREAAEQDPAGVLAASLAQGDGAPIECIFAAAAQGDAATGSILASRAHYMGIALANLVNVLNPDLIVLGGVFAQGAPWLLPATQATMRQCAFANLGERVRLTTTQFGQDVGAIGAAALALSAFFYQRVE